MAVRLSAGAVGVTELCCCSLRRLPPPRTGMGRGVAVLNSVGLYYRYGDSVCNIAPDIPPDCTLMHTYI